MPRFSLRVLAAVVVAIAVSLGLLRMPYSHVAYGVEVFAAAAIATAVVFAIGSCQPAKSFWLGFLFTVLLVLWSSYGEGVTAWGLPRVVPDMAAYVDGQLGWSAPLPAPGTTIYVNGEQIQIVEFDDNGSFVRRSYRKTSRASEEELRQAIPLPRPEAFESIFVHLSALLFGLLGGSIAWAARRRAMRTGNAQLPAG